MPILKESTVSSGLWQQLNAEKVFENIETKLTPLTFDSGEHQQPNPGQAVKAKSQWGENVLWQEQKFGQHIVATAGSAIGFPAGQIFNGAKEILSDVNPVSTLVTAFTATGASLSDAENGLNLNFDSKGPLGKVMTDVVGQALDAIGQIGDLAGDLVPVIGGVVKALANVLQFLAPKGAVEEEHYYYLLNFDPVYDLLVANEDIISSIRSGGGGPRDWTNIWSPVATDPWWGVPIRQKSGSDWGINLTEEGTTEGVESRRVGAIPRSGNICRGWEINQTGDVEYGTRPIGALLPTGRDQVAKLWSMALKPGAPAAFCIDTAQLKDEWAQSLYQLRKFLTRDELLGTGGLSRDARATFVNGIGKDYFGWGSFDPSLGDSDITGKTSDYLVNLFGIEDSEIMRNIEELAAVQRSSVNTVACAYVTEQFAALSYGSSLRSTWAQNRMDLLQHPAVCQVDLESVPDWEYRNVVESAQSARGCQGGGMVLSAGPAFRPSAPPPPPPRNGLSGLMSASLYVPPGRGTSGGKGPLLLAAAMLGLIVMNKKRR